MGRARTPKSNDAPKPAEPPVEVIYDLFDLPTAFHKAGLAGLILLIESLKARQVLTADEAKFEVSATRATVAFTEPLVLKLMDDLYDARKVERRYAQPKKKDNKPISPKRIDVEQREERGKVKDVKWHIYDEVEPWGQFLRDQYPEMPDDRSWLKLWREMLWNVPRGRPTQREPFEQRAAGQACKEGPNAWTELVPLFKVRPLFARMFLEQGEYISEPADTKDYPARAMSLGKAIWRRWTAALMKAKPLSVTR
jgi:CRISPR-associated protein Cmx8